VPITAGEGCVHPDEGDATYVVCTLTDQGDYWPYVEVELGDEDDDLTLRAGRDLNSVYGGPGDDTLDSDGYGRLRGEEGDGTIINGDDAYGGPGNDSIHVPEDRFAHGGDGHDMLIGGAGPQNLYGGRGNDVIHGQDGGDVVYGNSGGDTLRGGGGDDTLSGGPGTDDVSQA
jgi:Ca2+-binding RTX toxin-like protein